MKLRSYQQNAIDAVEATIAFGSKNIILDATTSFGKSITMAGICKLYSDKHIVIMVNIEPLIDQIADTLKAMGIEYSILKAQRESEFDPTKRINIVMSQTYYARAEKLSLKCDMLLIDERHREYDTPRTKKLIKGIEPEVIVGFSGTCFDQSGFALHEVETIQTISSRELTEQGYLAPLRFFVPKWSERVNYSSVKRSGSDYSMTSLDEIIGSQKHIQNIIDSMNELNAKNKKTLVFASTIEMCNKLEKALQEDGYSAYAYHSENSKKQNQRLMNAFRNNSPYSGSDQDLEGQTLFNNKGTEPDTYVKCIISVSKLNIGFSVSDIDLGVIVRKIGVLSLYRQSAGRLKRTSNSLDELLSKYDNTNESVAFVCSVYNEEKEIREQLKLKNIKHIFVYPNCTEPTSHREAHDHIIYNVRPNKTYGEILDLAQCLGVHGFPDDEYIPPVKQLMSEDNKKALLDATKHLVLENLEITLGDKLQEVTRKSYNKEIQAIKDNPKKLSEMTTKELSAKLQLEKDPVVIIAILATLFDMIHCEDMQNQWGQPTRGYKAKNGKIVQNFKNGSSIGWMSELWVEKLEEQDSYHKQKYIKSLRTRSLNMVRDKSSIWGIRFFIEYLIQKDEEQMVQNLEPKDEDGTRKYTVEYDGFDLESEDIPF